MEEEKPPHKFQNKFEISYEDYMLARFLPMLGVIQKFISEFGEEKTLQIVSDYIDELARIQINQSRNKNQIENFTQFKISLLELYTTEFMNNSVTFDIIEDTDDKLVLKFTKCLWAKTFNKLGFDGKPGYRTACRANYSLAKNLSPNVKLTRTKTLMQGDECCNLIYTWKDN